MGCLGWPKLILCGQVLLACSREVVVELMNGGAKEWVGYLLVYPSGICTVSASLLTVGSSFMEPVWQLWCPSICQKT